MWLRRPLLSLRSIPEQWPWPQVCPAQPGPPAYGRGGLVLWLQLRLRLGATDAFQNLPIALIQEHSRLIGHTLLQGGAFKTYRACTPTGGSIQAQHRRFLWEQLVPRLPLGRYLVQASSCCVSCRTRRLLVLQRRVSLLMTGVFGSVKFAPGNEYGPAKIAPFQIAAQVGGVGKQR